MGKGKPDSSSITNMKNDVSTNSSASAASTTEQEFQMQWSRWLGIRRACPILAAMVDAAAMWTVGKGYKADKAVKANLIKIKGTGKQTFNTILFNSVKTYMGAGDFFAEKVMTKRKKLINLKTLNPGTIKIIIADNGMIRRYEQWDKTKEINKWNPDQMFHLPWNGDGDEVHGNGVYEKLEDNVESYNEVNADMRIVFHRYIKPLIISHVDTDDEGEISAFKTKLDKAVANGENLVVPHDMLKLMERMSMPDNATLDPFPWIAKIERDFITATGVPAIIIGSGEERDTEAGSKILYLAFQQMIEWNQLFLEEQILSQLGFEINLEFPASLEPTMQKDQGKSRSMNNHETAIGEGSGGKKSR